MNQVVFICLFFVASSAESKVVMGILNGESEITIKAKSQGEIVDISFQEGQKVKRDQVIAVIDNQQETIERNLAKVEHKTAHLDHLATQKLKKYVSKEERLKKRDAYLKKKAQFELKEYMLSNTQIKSPIDGVISKSYFDKGETVSVGDKVYEVVDMRKLKIDIYVPLAESNLLEVGSKIKFHTEEDKSKYYTANISYVSPVVDAASGTIKVRLSIDNINSDGKYLLKPGSMAYVEYGD